MAASGSSDGHPPEPRPPRPFVVRPTGGSHAAQPPARPAPAILRPFVPRVSQSVERVPEPVAAAPAVAEPAPVPPAEPAAREAAHADLDAAAGSGDAGDLGRETVAEQEPEPAGVQHSAPAGVAEQTMLDIGELAPSSADGETDWPGAKPGTVADALADPGVAYAAAVALTPVVPGADASDLTPSAGSGPAVDFGWPDEPPSSDVLPLDEFLEAQAPLALGDERADRLLAARSAAGVVPPAEAWPDDVWPPDDTAVAAVPRSTPEQTTEPTTGVLDNELGLDLAIDLEMAAPEATRPDVDALEIERASYPLAEPDAPTAYAADAALPRVTPPSAVYIPEDAGAWAASSVAPDATRSTEPDAAVDGALPTAAGEPTATAAVHTAAAPREPADALADRLQALAEQLRAGTLTAGEARAEMRDSELLVALLGAVLKAGR